MITERLIDFIRVHVSMIGGLTPAKKLATLCEAFGIRTAWHGPNDITPVGVAAQLHLDLSSPNFGVQEFFGFSDVAVSYTHLDVYKRQNERTSCHVRSTLGGFLMKKVMQA